MLTRVIMERLMKQLASLRTKCKRFGDELEIKTTTSDLRSGCFAMLFNSTTLTLELLSYYYGIWKRTYTMTKEQIERSKEENAQRCMEITKMQFILAISNIEYCMKEVLDMYPRHSLAKWCCKQKRIYLSGIINESKKIRLIDDKEHRFWDCILKVRNVVVHNNAIADFSKTYQINGLTISFVKGKMLKGKLDFFIKLTDKAIDLYRSWVMNFV